MTKFYGTVGYGITNETAPSVFEIVPEEHKYYGDIISNGVRWQSAEHLNDDMAINHRVKIVADAFMYEHYSQIRYVELMGVRWKVTNIELSRPTITLTLGGEYNGPVPT